MSLDGLGEPQEVEPPRPQGGRLALSLLGAGVVAAGLVLAGAWFFGGIAQTESGLCRVTWAPCTRLSLASVEELAGVELPGGTEVVSGYAQESTTGTEFRAQVVLPADAASPLPSTYYETAEAPEEIPALAEIELAGARYWSRGEVAGSFTYAVDGMDEGGRTVILFDTHPGD